jgi:NAD(P)-dependent dehydrogenase (short-subunit alcohol dehydrogenase family)
MTSDPTTLRLEGRLVLITGAAKRLGRALALAAARAGAHVALHYGRSRDAAEQTADEIRTLGRRAEIFQADLADPAQVADLFRQAQARLGTIHALINNASIFAPLDWQQTTLADWDQHLRVNLTAPFLLTQAFARALPPEENGRVLNLLDWRALRPGPDHLPYTISKAGLAALTRSLAAALAPRIQVNGLALGAVLPAHAPGSSETSKVSTPEELDEVIRPVLAGRWADLDEVEQAAMFLLAGPAYITGEILHLDGGRHLV